MDQIEPDSLYDERVEISRARPLLQGDVFDGVVLPGFGEEPRKVQIVAHPCSMRAGATLTPRVTVAPIDPHREVTGKGWDGPPRLMPLPDLVDGENFATKFIDVTACPAELLTRDRRIATLSNRGIYVLQQRLVKHYTRVEMSLELLWRESAPVLTEAQLLWDWLERAHRGRTRHGRGARYRGGCLRGVAAGRGSLPAGEAAHRDPPHGRSQGSAARSR